MNFKVILSVLFSFATITIFAQAIEIGKKDSLVSEILNETRTFKIILPPTYDQYSKIKYPVNYILDGDFLIHSTSGIVEYMSKTGQIPEMIQIYISNTDRTRDFTPTQTYINYEGEKDTSLENSGGGQKFLRFLNTELVPYIDRNYRTNSFNMIVGRSFAGLIAGVDFLQEKSKLSAYLLIDPSLWWDQQYIVKLIDTVSIKILENKKLYMSSSDNFEFSDFIEKMRNSQNSFYSGVLEKDIDTTKIKLEYFEQNTHGTVTVPSIYKGLVFIFDDYFLKGMKYRSAKEIIDHFEQFSEKNGAEFTPLEPMINWLASIHVSKDKLGALKLYELNAINYPESVNALLNLAAQYEQFNMVEKAIEEYRKILKIDPDNKKAINQIKALRE